VHFPLLNTRISAELIGECTQQTLGSGKAQHLRQMTSASNAALCHRLPAHQIVARNKPQILRSSVSDLQRSTSISSVAFDGAEIHLNSSVPHLQSELSAPVATLIANAVTRMRPFTFYFTHRDEFRVAGVFIPVHRLWLKWSRPLHDMASALADPPGHACR
jgi:hypothetical protein